MLAEERFALILEQLNEKRTVTVQQLCEALHTSESTIRRDLTELDRQGRLTKVHGGATLPDSRFLADEPTMEAKETLAVAEKRSIAAAAAALITAEDFVFIDAGTTTLELVRALTEYFGLPFIQPMDPVQGIVRVDYGTLNLRSAPSSSGTIIANLPNGAAVTVCGEWQGWYVVEHGNHVGYAAAAYIDV